MTDTVLSASSRLMLSIPKSGISYVCSNCGTLLYHIGSEYQVGGRPSPLRPKEVAERMKTCPECGHRLKLEPEEDVTVTKSNSH